MILEKNHLLEESFEYKLFNPFDSQQIMDDEGNDLNLIFLMIIRELLDRLIALLMNFHARLIVF